MKSLILLLITLSISFPSAVTAGEYCNAFKAGYRSVTNNLTIEPVCPEEPPIVFGQRNGMRGFNVGMKAAKAEYELGLGNGYEKKERCESGWCRFKDIHYSINAVVFFIMIVYASLGFLSGVIFKEPIFLRLRHRHRYIWQEMGSPKFFALMENFNLLKNLSYSRDRMNKIGGSDQLLFWLINVTIKIDNGVSKALWLIVGTSLIGVINLVIIKFF